ncbi:MAG: hypothetical protein JWM11_4450, partial [Planctomycetaceae bacterium]|nr:hypothetical protein [Planctomycetaceae bacterium]
MNDRDFARLQRAFPWPSCRPQVEINWGPAWFSDNEEWGHLRIFRMLVSQHAKTIVELGSFLGRSAAGWLKAFPAAHVIAIDTWGGSPEHHANEELSNLLPRLLETFQANL